MKILAFDTSMQACSAALCFDDECYEKYTLAPRQHNQLILPMIEALLTQANCQLKDLDAIAFANGPGSFTGVRLATGVAQGLAFAAQLPLLPISTLAALAQGAWRLHAARNVAVAVDARMQAVYWGQYQLNQEELMRLSEPELICAIDALPVFCDTNVWVGVGDAWANPQVVSQVSDVQNLTAFYPDSYPHARDIVELAKAEFAAGRALECAQAQPNYLREYTVKA